MGDSLIPYALAGTVLFRIRKEIGEKSKKVLFVLGFLALLRLVYGRGMFGFDYHTYFSIFWWVSLFNTAALLQCAMYWPSCVRMSVGRKTAGHADGNQHIDNITAGQQYRIISGDQ